jgi:hypothetical protein
VPSKEKTRYSSRSVQGLMKMGDGASCVRNEGKLSCSTVKRNGQL